MSGPKWKGVFATGCFAFALLAPAAHADAIFSIDTNTSSITGQSGYMDFAFSYYDGAAGAIATITAFSSDATLGGCSAGCLTGDVSGELPGTVVVSNGAPAGPIDDLYEEPVIWGTYIEFVVTLSGPGLSTSGETASSTFALTYYDSLYDPLLSADASGASAMLTVEPDQSVSTETFADTNGGFDTTLAANSPAPEPSSWLLFGCGLLGAGLAGRRWRRLAA